MAEALAQCPIKVCGLTRLEDARLAWELGASALGFIFHPRSPRNIEASRVAEIKAGLPLDAFCIGVFVDRSAEEVLALAAEARLDAVQLHGRESKATCEALVRTGLPVLKAIRAEDEPELETHPASAFLLDAVHPTLAGGTGLKADWNLARHLAQRHRLILAGGLEPSNIVEAFEFVRPAGLDLSSGVEATPGIKDPEKLHALFSVLNRKGERPCLIPR